MAINIKQVTTTAGTHEINAKYIQDSSGNAKTWQDITELVEASFDLIVLDALPTADASSYSTYHNNIVLIKDTKAITGTYVEYVIVRSGTSGSYTYAWEDIGTTQTDLSNYLQKDTTYSAAALEAGAHTHTVTIPTITVDKTKFLKAVATDMGMTFNTDTFVKSYPGVTSKLVTDSITYGTANVGTEISCDDITDWSAGSGDFSATVSDDGVLSFSHTHTAPTISYTARSIAPAVASSSTVSFATGGLATDGAGSSVMTGLGTATTGDAHISVKGITNPTITISEDGTSGVVNEHVTTGTVSATTSSDGTHTHDVKTAA